MMIALACIFSSDNTHTKIYFFIALLSLSLLLSKSHQELTVIWQIKFHPHLQSHHAKRSIL